MLKKLSYAALLAGALFASSPAAAGGHWHGGHGGTAVMVGMAAMAGMAGMAAGMAAGATAAGAVMAAAAGAGGTASGIGRADQLRTQASDLTSSAAAEEASRFANA